MKKCVILVLSLFLISSGYLVYNSLTKEKIQVEEKTLDRKFIGYTLNGSETDKSYEELVENNKVNSVTCENGSTAVWSESEKTIKLSNINIPDYCTVDFSTEGLMPQFIRKILADNPTVSERTDFSVTNTSNTTGTIYKTNKTEDGSEVYYYSGNTTNNWVKFGKYSKAYSSDLTTFYTYGSDMYWRIIRTNEDGSVRLLYAGTSPSSSLALIDNLYFNYHSDHSAYVGYMYGGVMSLAENRANTNSSDLKQRIDSWYETNLLTNYDKYISKSAIYCGDRSVTSGTWTVRQDTTFYYASRTRLSTNKTPSYKCGSNGTGGLFETTQAVADKYSVSTVGGGNGNLTYGAALMTADEVAFAGGVYGVSLASPYAWYSINSNGDSIVNSYWWLLSPFGCWFNGGLIYNLAVDGSSKSGKMYVSYTDSYSGIRPVISIDPCAKVTGSGTATDPYQIDTTNSTCS